MDKQEWLKKQSQKGAPQYTHFDRRTSLKHCFDYITSKESVSHHGFYPFIHYTIKNRKVKEGKKTEPKERQIYYAAHLDGWIYRYYSYLINEIYNQRVKKDNIDSIAVAYRTDLGQSNIQFAKNAFDYIQNNNPCYVMIGDFTDFFDKLDHYYLKKQLCDLLLNNRLQDDIYAVYKNITRFSFVKLKDLLTFKGFEDTPKGRRKFNSHTNERALQPKEFNQIRGLIKPNTSGHGIPQGSPISAALSNVYMLTADKKIQDYISSLGGFYMRYSDDFIVAVPWGNIDLNSLYKGIKNILDSTPGLLLSGPKTKLFCIEDTRITPFENTITPSASKKPIIEFLGFSFDGEAIRIRDKTISRYYNRVYRKARTITNGIKNNPNNKRISAKNLYKKYSYKGSLACFEKITREPGKPVDKNQICGNFIDYVARAKREFKETMIDTITNRHMQKIRKKLRNKNNDRGSC